MGTRLRAWPSSDKIVRELVRGGHMLRDSGVRAGWQFVREEVLRNTWLRLREGQGLAGTGARVECNLCGWAGSSFLTHCSAGYVDRNAYCPRCRSYGRHRGFAWLLGHELAGELERLAAGTGRRILFGPEPGMALLLGRYLERIEGSDIDAGRQGVDLVMDAQALELPDASVDFAASFHVLEHVPDDRRALRELARVLSPRGRLVLAVPTLFENEHTHEFGAARADLNGHWREYGSDIAVRLREAGLAGRSFRLTRDLPEPVRRRCALVDEEIFWLQRADGA